jgi:hypothetical protein
VDFEGFLFLKTGVIRVVLPLEEEAVGGGELNASKDNFELTSLTCA